MADLLPAEFLDQVAETLLEQYSVWYSPKAEPWLDREGILLDACNLMRAAGGDESSAVAHVAAHLFGAISPHLGSTEPGTGPLSSATEAKALLKSWRLPQTGKKAELQARIREQVDVAKVPVLKDGVATLVIPAHSHVSIAAYQALRPAARNAERISQTKAKDIFGLRKYSLDQLPSGYLVDDTNAFFPSKLYLLTEVKAKVLWGPLASWARLSAGNKRSANWRVDYDAEQKGRGDALAAALVARGWEPTGAGSAAEMVSSHWGGFFTWGVKDNISSEAAADFCEQMHFCTTTAAELFRAWKVRSQTEHHVKSSLSQYKKQSAREEWAGEQTVKEWARGQASMKAITDNWRVPRSLLPKMERACGLESKEPLGERGCSGACDKILFC